MSAQPRSFVVPSVLPACSRLSTMSDAEWQTRIDLAACYRLFHHYRMTDLIYTHISARVPGRDDRFLINAYGMMFDEITASSLVEVDIDGNVHYDPNGLGINPGGFTIHSAVHQARHDIACVMHSHTAAGIAVAGLECGLLPMSQHSMRFTGRLAYHDYEGVYFTDGERKRLQASLAGHFAMILRHHGLLACGRTISEAWDVMHYLERACQAQATMLAQGRPLAPVGKGVAEQVAGVFDGPDRKAVARIWPALLRMLDRIDPSYRN